MKVNKSSWHYRLVNEMTTPKDNLCQYTRQIIGFSCLLTLVAAIAGFIICVLAYPMWRPWLQEGVVGFFSGLGWIVIGWNSLGAYRKAWKTANRYSKNSPAWLAKAIEEGRTWDISAWYHRDWFWKLKERWADRPPKPYVHKEPNIFVEYIKAIHGKVCPRIDFE